MSASRDFSVSSTLFEAMRTLFPSNKEEKLWKELQSLEK
jgi:hypothetical protein